MEPREYVLEQGRAYWSADADAVRCLPLAHARLDAGALPPRMELVSLPGWGADAGVDGAVLVPAWAVAPGESPAWERTDWLGAAFWFLSGQAETAHERSHGPVHSYACRLQGWDARIWDRAWVNRMFLFLRRWAARVAQADEERLLGPKPQWGIVLTHDVDAVSKTLPIRLKQCAMHGFNAARSALGGRWRRSLSKLGLALRFLAGPGDYWRFDEIMDLERRAGVRSVFNFYAGGERDAKAWLMDPGYDVASPRLTGALRSLYSQGWHVGLHQSFDAWADAGVMEAQRRALGDALGGDVGWCRQHWLRFSWADTWRAQARAGLCVDATLGFNDRPALRTGAALAYRPWNDAAGAPHGLVAVPMMLMDSHLYDYASTVDGGPPMIDRWLDEVRFVGGTASVIWHQRVFSGDYGWGNGYRHLVERVGSRHARDPRSIV